MMGEELSNNTELNKIAQERFQQIRKRMRLDSINIGITKSDIPIKPINKKLLDKMFNEQPEVYDIQVDHPDMQKIIDEEVDLIDETFTFIASLNLSSTLSLALGLIFSYSKTKNKKELEKAMIAIENEMSIK